MGAVVLVVWYCVVHTTYGVSLSTTPNLQTILSMISTTMRGLSGGPWPSRSGSAAAGQGASFARRAPGRDAATSVNSAIPARMPRVARSHVQYKPAARPDRARRYQIPHPALPRASGRAHARSRWRLLCSVGVPTVYSFLAQCILRAGVRVRWIRHAFLPAVRSPSRHGIVAISRFSFLVLAVKKIKL